MHLLATESTGTLSPAVTLLLKRSPRLPYAQCPRAPYGLGRAPPPSFFFHVRTTSPLSPSPLSVPTPSLSIRNNAAALAFNLSHGII